MPGVYCDLISDELLVDRSRRDEMLYALPASKQSFKSPNLISYERDKHSKQHLVIRTTHNLHPKVNIVNAPVWALYAHQDRHYCAVVATLGGISRSYCRRRMDSWPREYFQGVVCVVHLLCSLWQFSTLSACLESFSAA